ncbi:MAG TPA: hypothetical protein VLN61_09820 [Pseudolabrys sp.]|nr:hypothetical protein [Pseudolabrys sp.]
MADKRTTPETPAGAQPDAPQDAGSGPRRKKRAAPTIDLTATEMPSPEAASPPQPDPQSSAQEPRADPVGTRPGRHIMATLVAGIAGAATVMLVLVALWLTGLLPVRYVALTDTGAQAPADTKAIDALTQRVNKIEGTISKLPAGDAGVIERLAAADSAMKSLGIALTALNRRSDDTAATASQAREHADTAVKAITDLRASVQDAAKNSSAGIAPAELDALQKRMEALEQSAKSARDDIAKASSTDIAARLALSAAGLRDAVASGAPFAAELAQAKSLGADDKVLAPLAPFAMSGVPASPALAQELRALLPAILKISGAQAPEGGFLERLQANAGKLVRIRPVDAPPSDDPSAVLARLEIDAAKADIAAALADLGKLADATRAPAQAWIAKAQARQAALAAARQYAADTARALGPR